ncbi:MAG: hypothetical protein BWK80_24755 [Desulfobacteraceae bacterium IS3]|nr:MAG: hypothetical protein BWK80_24755 [Desulfobacteraceae bacterium IS3]
MKKIFTYLLLFIVIFPLYPAVSLSDFSRLPAPRSSGRAEKKPEVRITGEKFSLHADKTPLKNILQRIAESGVTVRIDPELNPDISASFEDRDIQKGLDSILKTLNHVLIWDSVEVAKGRIFKLAEIQVFQPGKKERMKKLKKNSALAVVKNPKDGSLFVKDEILLRLAPGMSFSEFKKLIEKIGGTIIEKNSALGIYKIRLPENTDVPALTDMISKYPGIRKAEPNYAYHIGIAKELFPSLLGDAAVSPSKGAAPVAILDTGLAQVSGLDNLVTASLDALNPDEPISDAQGHGTQMALIASGLIQPYGTTAASENYPPIISIKTFDENGFTSNFGIMRSLDFAIENGARVASLSWGSETESEFLEEALTYAESKNLIVVAAVGNKATGKPFYPAAYSSVIGVGALKPDGSSWENSNYGSFVDISAPGFASLPVGYKGDPGAYAGTSISTAYTANRIAGYLSEHPKATKLQVLAALKEMF